MLITRRLGHLFRTDRNVVSDFPLWHLTNHQTFHPAPFVFRLLTLDRQLHNAKNGSLRQKTQSIQIIFPPTKWEDGTPSSTNSLIFSCENLQFIHFFIHRFRRGSRSLDNLLLQQVRIRRLNALVILLRLIDNLEAEFPVKRQRRLIVHLERKCSYCSEMVHWMIAW